MALSNWVGFLAASILIALSPGPGAAISMSTGMRYGFASALRVISGLQCALLCQLGVVAAGLGALLVASPQAFDAIRWAGAAYLVWLGIQKWRDTAHETPADDSSGKRGDFFLQGLFVNLSNPKAIVFMTAFIPPFIDSSRAQLPQFLAIALIMCSTDVIVMSGYALLAAHMKHWLRGDALKWQNRFFGSLFVFLGVWLAAFGKN